MGIFANLESAKRESAKHDSAKRVSPNLVCLNLVSSTFVSSISIFSECTFVETGDQIPVNTHHPAVPATFEVSLYVLCCAAVSTVADLRSPQQCIYLFTPSRDQMT